MSIATDFNLIRAERAIVDILKPHGPARDDVQVIGHGFIIGRYIFTAAHCAEENIVDVEHEGKRATAGVQLVDRWHDFALLFAVNGEADDDYEAIVNAAPKIHIACFDGLPKEGTAAPVVVRSQGEWREGVAYIGRDEPQFSLDAQIEPGDSGGPVLLHGGSLLGVVCARHCADTGAAIGVLVSRALPRYLMLRKE